MSSSRYSRGWHGSQIHSTVERRRMNPWAGTQKTSCMWWAWFIGHVPGSTSLYVQWHFCRPIRLWDLFRVWFEAVGDFHFVSLLLKVYRIKIQAFFWRDHFIRWTDFTTSTELIKYGKQKLKHAWEQTNRWTKGSEQSLHVCFESYLWIRSCLVGVLKLQSRWTLFYLRDSCRSACVCTVVLSNPLASVLALACLAFELGTQNGFPCFLCDKMSGLRGDLACSLSDLWQTVALWWRSSSCLDASVCVVRGVK